MQQRAAARVATAMAEQCVGTRISRLHRLVARRFEQALRPLGLTLPQLEVLAALTVAGRPVRPTTLADLLGAERSTVSRNLAALEAAGWIVTAQRSPTGRAMTVMITDRGTATLASAEEAWTRVQADVVDLIGVDAPATLDRWLEEIDSPANPATR